MFNDGKWVKLGYELQRALARTALPSIYKSAQEPVGAAKTRRPRDCHVSQRQELLKATRRSKGLSSMFVRVHIRKTGAVEEWMAAGLMRGLHKPRPIAPRACVSMAQMGPVFVSQGLMTTFPSAITPSRSFFLELVVEVE